MNQTSTDLKIRCAIVDDEPLALDLLESYVRKTPFLTLVGRFPNAVQAMSQMRDLSVDLLFLDIQMPEMTGLEFSNMLPDGVRVVFTTAFAEYALDGFRVDALDYLLKPIAYTDFLKAADRAAKWFSHMQSKEEVETVSVSDNRIFVKSDRRMVAIDLDKILYIESLRDYVKFYFDSSDEPIMAIMNLKDIEQALPANRFMRIHRSFIVQLRKVAIIENNRIVFGKTYIPIGDNYKEAFNAYLNKFIL